MEKLIIYKKYKITDFKSKSVQMKKPKVANELLPTISQETIEYMTINNKANPQSLTEIPPSIANTEAPTLAQELI